MALEGAGTRVIDAVVAKQGRPSLRFSLFWKLTRCGSKLIFREKNLHFWAVIMFVGKFNFEKACANVFSSNRSPPRPSDKPVKRLPRQRPLQQLADQNNALDQQTTAFAEKNAKKKEKDPNRGRTKSKASLEAPKGMKRGLSADPHMASGEKRDFLALKLFE